jgi:hypothetical protein
MVDEHYQTPAGNDENPPRCETPCDPAAGAGDRLNSDHEPGMLAQRRTPLADSLLRVFDARTHPVTLQRPGMSLE